ncbi:Zn-dependent oxidoreductase [Nocardia panacis]|uniref:Zn-dependent oxidoreductase n=1 Tax=Nocardia panacis TaxID=2340916 RepID=A0A3A4JVW6_9NOCA|nr:zinc-binding dehydrogenase [Nocardia panacis]RJO70732.1 Zn-dependent oxidoreductase [Nocardia panacis]
MKAVWADHPAPEDPLSAVRIGSFPDPPIPDGWVAVAVRAVSLNHHELWILRGAGVPADRYPIVLGSDCAGIDPSGREVLVTGLVFDPKYAHAPLDPRRTILGECHHGTFATTVAVPAHTLIPKPPGFSFEEAACLCGAWLTAYRMLFTRSGLRPGHTVLIQGAGGGVATALVALARAAGYRVWVTTRTEAKRVRALAIGAHQAFPSGAVLPAPVDAVMETVGAATWNHSLRALRPGGTLVVSGATTGALPAAHLTRIFAYELSVVGSTSGTAEEATALFDFMAQNGLRPLIDTAYPFDQARLALRRLAAGEFFGKLTLSW